ncbi:hypothetical protein T459_28971 [Capsicum annuum]|uniref:Calpain-type cysteine protease DEK1 n=1 Tax=Capsicum annuum TaxID=4072 RepID=A0A2G2YIB1_CAPAN|nr:hypothetical protein T459_28971 [Capsicum annuum]
MLVMIVVIVEIVGIVVTVMILAISSGGGGCDVKLVNVSSWSCDGGMIVSTNTVASVVDIGGRGGDAGDSGGDVVVLVLIDELVGSRDRPVAVDGGGVGGRGVHGSIWIGLTSAWTLDDFKVAIAKYISSPPMSDTNLKVLHKMSGLSAKALVVLPCYVSLEVDQFVIAKLATRRIMDDGGLLLEIFNKFVNELKEKERKRQEDKSTYIEMMKHNFFFFRSSTNDANKTPSPPLKSKEVSSWRSVSLSSRSFYDSGSGKKNFTDLSKSPHGHSKKVHPKKSSRNLRRDLSVPLLIRTITRLKKKKEKVKELKSETLLTTVLREKLYSEEMNIKQLQANLAITVRGNDILKYEVQNALDALSYATPKLKYLELQVLKKDENINQLTNDLQECIKELGIVKMILPKVFQERDFMWEEVKSYSEMNMLLNYEINMLKRKEVALESTSIHDIVHQNSTCGATENVGTAAKPNGTMHEPVRADRPNEFSNNSLSILSCIQIEVDIPSQISGPSTFKLPDHALVRPGREGGIRVGESPILLGSELQPSFITLETDRAAVENVFNLKGIRALHLGLLYVGSHVVLLVYSILYFGHCISYAVVASLLLGAAVSRHLSVTDPLAARRDAMQTTVIRLREGFCKKDQNSSASSSEGCGSSVKCSSSADAGHFGNETVPCTSDGSTWNNIEGINSDKSIDSGRPSLALHSSSCRSVVQEPEVGSSYVDKNLEHNSSLVVCSSSGLKSQGSDSSTSTSTNQQILDLNLALAFQEKLFDPRITSMLKRKERHTDRELANLLQDKGLDPNFAVMLKENVLDPMILALLQRSSLYADREHHDSNPPVTNSNDVEDVLPNHISFSEELRLQGLGKWLQRCRVMLYYVAGTPERAWLLFSLIFILETVVVAIFRPKTIKLLNAKHQ